MGSEVEGREAAALTPDLEHGLPVDRGVPEPIEWNPEGLRYFVTEAERRAVRSGEHVGSDDDEAGKRRAGPHIREGTEKLVWPELPAHFFGGFSESGVAEVAVGGIQSSSGEPDVAGPGVPGSLCPADKQHRVRVGRHDDGDGGPVGGRIERLSGLRLAGAK
jgi:hypothetical protein